MLVTVELAVLPSALPICALFVNWVPLDQGVPLLSGLTVTWYVCDAAGALPAMVPSDQLRVRLSGS